MAARPSIQSSRRFLTATAPELAEGVAEAVLAFGWLASAGLGLWSNLSFCFGLRVMAEGDDEMSKGWGAYGLGKCIRPKGFGCWPKVHRW